MWNALLCVAGATAQFILLPGVPIQMGTLLPVLMSADALGVLLGWRYLDHLGHLGGAAFGEQPSRSPHSNCNPCQANTCVWCVALLAIDHISRMLWALMTQV